MHERLAVMNVLNIAFELWRRKLELVLNASFVVSKFCQKVIAIKVVDVVWRGLHEAIGDRHRSSFEHSKPTAMMSIGGAIMVLFWRLRTSHNSMQRTSIPIIMLTKRPPL